MANFNKKFNLHNESNVFLKTEFLELKSKISVIGTHYWDLRENWTSQKIRLVNSETDQ